MAVAMAPALKPGSDHEHPVVAWAGICAVLGAILLISGARFEVHGPHARKATGGSEDPTPAAPPHTASPGADRQKRESEVEDAVAAGRWAAGFSP
jgi:hypothetical protein